MIVNNDTIIADGGQPVTVKLTQYPSQFLIGKSDTSLVLGKNLTLSAPSDRSRLPGGPTGSGITRIETPVIKVGSFGDDRTRGSAVIVRGTVEAYDDHVEAINADADNGRIHVEKSGLIRTHGFEGYAISVRGVGNEVVVDGRLETSGDGGSGIIEWYSGDLADPFNPNQIRVNGEIAVSGAPGWGTPAGVNLSHEGSSVVLNGRIAALSDDSIGILVSPLLPEVRHVTDRDYQGTKVTINERALVHVAQNGTGLYIDDAGAVVDIAGRVHALGPNSVGISSSSMRELRIRESGVVEAAGTALYISNGGVFDDQEQRLYLHGTVIGDVKLEYGSLTTVEITPKTVITGNIDVGIDTTLTLAGGHHNIATMDDRYAGFGRIVVNSPHGGWALADNLKLQQGMLVQAGRAELPGAISTYYRSSLGEVRVNRLEVGQRTTLALQPGVWETNLEGDLHFNENSVFEVATNGVQTSRINVGNHLTIKDGSAIRIRTLDLAEGWLSGQNNFTILTASSRDGEFSDEILGSAFLTPKLSFEQHGEREVIVLQMALDEDTYEPDLEAEVIPPDPDPDPGTDPNPDPGTDPGTDPGLEPEVSLPSSIFQKRGHTPNQRHAARAFEQFGLAEGSDSRKVVANILALPNEASVRRAFDLASGETHASGQHLVNQSFGMFSNALIGQATAALGSGGTGRRVQLAPLSSSVMQQASDSPDPAAEAFRKESSSSLWFTPLGGGGSFDNDRNAATFNWWNLGLATGYEKSLDDQTVVGFGLGYARSRGSIDARLSKMKADTINLGIYGGWAGGPWSIAGTLSYAASHISANRQIVFGSINRHAHASYWNHNIGVSAEVAHGIPLSNATTLLPLLSIDLGWSGHGSFTETGANSLNLKVASKGRTNFDTGLGLSVIHKAITGNGQVVVEGRALWEHAFGNVVPYQSLAFAESPATKFEVQGPESKRDRLRVGAGLMMKASNKVTILTRYDGIFSGNQKSHTGSVGLSLSF